MKGVPPFFRLILPVILGVLVNKACWPDAVVVQTHYAPSDPNSVRTSATPFLSLEADSALQCARQCTRNEACLSFQVAKTIPPYACFLLHSTSDSASSWTGVSKFWDRKLVSWQR